MIKEALHITRLYLKMTYGSRTVLIFQLLLPLIFTFLIGQATGGFGGDGSSSMTVTWPLPVINEDAGTLGAELVTRLDADPALTVVAVNREVGVSAAETAVSRIEKDEAAAFLVIPANFSEKLLAGEGIALDFYTDPAGIQTVQPIEQVVLGAAGRLSGAVDVAAVATNVAAELGVFAGDDTRTAYFAAGLARAEDSWIEPPVVVRVNEDEQIVDTTSVIPTGNNQSSPGMMAMFVTFSMVGGAVALIAERQNGTLRRLMVMPIHKASILLGKLFGILLEGIVQMGLLIAAGALFFGVAWGSSPGALALMVGAFALAITSMGMMIAALARTPAQANALSTVLVMSLSALGGAWWPLEIVPDWMQIVGKLSPITWAMTGFQDIITRGRGITAVLPEVGVLLGFTAVFLAIGVYRFRYE
ncbi:MAG: ABC-2 transporter permease [Anaerolineales bacterium]|nr:ABC-2 transporter permease [Anaerolineales bacterium]